MATEDCFTVPRHFNRKTIARLFSKIEIDRETGCWNWTAGLSRVGYGKTNIGSELVSSHRLMYAWLVGPLPRGIGKDIPCLDHLCMNRRCCNPAHLELVLPKENLLRGGGACAVNARKTHCIRGHELPPIDGSYRCCDICMKEQQHLRYQENKEAVIARTKINATRRMNGPRRAELLKKKREHYYATRKLKRAPRIIGSQSAPDAHEPA